MTDLMQFITIIMLALLGVYVILEVAVYRKRQQLALKEREARAKRMLDILEGMPPGLTEDEAAKLRSAVQQAKGKDKLKVIK